MYRRGVITDEISQDLDVVLETAKRFSLEGLEIRTIWNTRVDQLDDAAVRRLREAVDAAGLIICGVAPPFYKCDIDRPAERAEHLEILRRSIDVGQRLGTNLIRTFTFWLTQPVANVWDRLVAYYQEPAEIARTSGVVLAVENEHSCEVGTGHELAHFLSLLDRPEVKALWDPGNAFHASETERAYPDGYLAVRDRIVHVHLKDAVREPGAAKAQHAPIGEGQVGIAEQLSALVRDGYNGFVSLETHWRPEAIDEQTMRLPGGQLFSEKAAGATIYCLKNWDRILADQRE